MYIILYLVNIDQPQIFSKCEWDNAIAGFTERYGLYRVDFTTFERTAKKSANYYSDLIRENGIPLPKDQCNPDAQRDKILYDTFPEGVHCIVYIKPI